MKSEALLTSFIDKYLIKFNPIKSPVITNIMNEKKLAPIHLATEMNKVKALEVMGRHKDVIDIQQGTIAEKINNEGEYL